MSFDQALAAKAFKLSNGGTLSGRELADRLGLKFAADAHHYAAVGAVAAEREAMALTGPELLLLRSLAKVQRNRLARGTVGSPKGPDVGWVARKSNSWAAATAAKRLGTHRAGEDEARPGTGLRLLTASRNGHIWLTPAGWALIHAIEQAEASV